MLSSACRRSQNRYEAGMLVPEHCATMAEVRSGVDALDRRIVMLLAERFRFMDAAARIKASRNAVRDEVRKAQVLQNAAAAAGTSGAPTASIVALYDQLVEASIAYELERFDALREDNSIPHP